LPRSSLVPRHPLTAALSIYSPTALASLQPRSSASAYSGSVEELDNRNSLVLDEEDKKLEIAIKKMVLEKPAQAAGSQAPGNDMSELKKMVANLSKKVELLSKKVCNGLYRLLCVCGGHLSLT